MLINSRRLPKPRRLAIYVGSDESKRPFKIPKGLLRERSTFFRKAFKQNKALKKQCLREYSYNSFQLFSRFIYISTLDLLVVDDSTVRDLYRLAVDLDVQSLPRVIIQRRLDDDTAAFVQGERDSISQAQLGALIELNLPGWNEKLIPMMKLEEIGRERLTAI